LFFSIDLVKNKRENQPNKKKTNTGVYTMRKEYDFSNSIKNPYAQKEKKQISINIETKIIAYFKSLAKKVIF